MKERYINTKENNVHYKGKVWVTPDRPCAGRNICLDFGRPELKVIAFVPEITEERVVNAIEAMGYDPKDWM